MRLTPPLIGQLLVCGCARFDGGTGSGFTTLARRFCQLRQLLLAKLGVFAMLCDLLFSRSICSCIGFRRLCPCDLLLQIVTEAPRAPESVCCFRRSANSRL